MNAVKNYGYKQSVSKTEKIRTKPLEKPSNLHNIDRLGNSFRMSKKYVPNEKMLDGFQNLLLFKK
jgi:hypothetical protein